MKKIKYLLRTLIACVTLSIWITNCFSQGTAINTTGAAADTSAMLDVSSTTKGIFIPRMTAAEKGAIHLLKNGLLIYQTDGIPGF